MYDGGETVATITDVTGGTSFWDLRAWGPAGPAERAVPSGGNFYAYAFDPSGNCVERTNSANNPAGGFAPYDLQMAYNAQGIQLGVYDEIDNGAGVPHASLLDDVGFGGQWGGYRRSRRLSGHRPGPSLRYSEPAGVAASGAPGSIRPDVLCG